VTFRDRLATGEPMVGVFCLIPAIEVIEVAGHAGFDFVIVDMEHGPYGFDSLRALLAASRIPVVVRVRTAEPADIGSALDIGADGVLVPHVSSLEMATAVVRASHFTPEGDRGANPYVRAAGYGSTPDWYAQANKSVAVMVMVEGVAGIRAMPQIVGLTGLDAVFLGPVDLSHALGFPGQVDHPQVVAELEKVAALGAEHGVATAAFAPDPERAQAWWRRGVRVVACGVDTQILHASMTATAAAARPV
jgi:4-hydroxy-2-oxoheptanedioate aldolase